MIERKVVGDRLTEFSIEQFVRRTISDVPIKEITFEKNPLGERITIYTSTPGLVIGREGANIKKLTQELKNNFDFENPQIKIGEVHTTHLSAAIVAKIIANDLANFGSQKFKLTGFKALMGIMNAGAMGCEIRISGKLPSARAKTWRFSKGYLKKTGAVSDFLIDKAKESVTLKTGVVGIYVQIMLPDTPLPDKITYYDEAGKVEAAPVDATVEEVVEESETVKNSEVANEGNQEGETQEVGDAKPTKKGNPKEQSSNKGKSEALEVKEE